MAYGRVGSAVSLVLVTVGIAIVAPSCANGDDEPSSSGSSSSVTEGDSGSSTVPNCVPTGPEVCDGKDNDCNGKVDEGFDVDGDGWVSCAIPGRKADCDDKDPKVNPGAAEVCNNVDDNCDGITDEGFDKDGDGFYSCVRGTTAADCDDTDAKIKPGATETCNGKDDDCNGKIDDIPAIIDSTISTGNAFLGSPVSANWSVTGNAQFGTAIASPAPGFVRLNDEVSNVSGALWWKGSYLFDAFDMTALITIQDKPGADGMSFAWVSGTDYGAVGGPGSALGVVGLAGPGYAVIIDTYTNTGELPAPSLAIMKHDGVRLAAAALPAIVRNNNGHTLRVKLDATKVSVWVDGINYVNEFALPAYVPFSGRWGFTAGTGAGNEIHWVSNIKMQFPNGQGCVVR